MGGHSCLRGGVCSPAAAGKLGKGRGPKALANLVQKASEGPISFAGRHSGPENPHMKSRKCLPQCGKLPYVMKKGVFMITK